MIMKTLFGRDGYKPLEDGENYVNKFVILKPENFKDEFQEARYQLFYATGGFGCYPEKIGGKVFGRLYDEPFDTRREYIYGVATEDAIKQWEQTYGIPRDVFFN